MSDDPSLRDLEAEVDADIRMNAAGTPDYDDLESPSEWLLDPVEAQEEAVELRSLHDAIEVLEGNDPDSPLSSA
jgi:hypothetical protein